MKEVKCPVCGRIADEKDLILLPTIWTPGVGWLCQKSCYEYYESKFGLPMEEGEHYGVTYGSVISNV